MPISYLPNGYTVTNGLMFQEDQKAVFTRASDGRVVWVARLDNPSLTTETLAWDPVASPPLITANGGFQIPRYTVATLPVAGTPGRVAFTTDNVQFQIDTGVAWQGVSTIVFPVTVGNGGTGLTTLTAHALLLGEGSGTLGAVTLTNGQLAIGSTGADPVASAITAGTGISVTNGAGSITVASTGLRTAAAGGLCTYISGTSMSIGPGAFVDDANTVLMTLGSTLTMSTNGAWVAGNNQPKDSSDLTLINGMTVHWHIIQRTDTGVVDILRSASATSPVLPANYTKSRRWKSFKFTAGAQTFQSFVHDVTLDYIGYAATTSDINSVNPGTAAVSRTMNVPTGISVVVEFNAWLGSPTINSLGLFSDLARNDEAPNVVGGTAPGAHLNAIAGATVPVGTFRLRTNTSGQVRSRVSGSDGSTNLAMFTTGYYDFGGRNS